VRVQEVKSGLQISGIREAVKGLLISFFVSLILISIILSFPVDYITGNRPYLKELLKTRQRQT